MSFHITLNKPFFKRSSASYIYRVLLEALRVFDMFFWTNENFMDSNVK